MVKISVITPMYNVKKYLRECLDSVANQTLKDIEVILVDDGSTDNTLEIAQSYYEKIPNLTIIQSENHGPGHARNLALNIASGEYIKFLDADDKLTKNTTLETMYRVAEKNDLDVLVGTYNPHFGPINIKPAYHTLGVEKPGMINLEEYKNYPFQEMPSIGDKLFKREHIGELRFPETQWEDLPFVPLLLADAKRLYFLDEEVCDYRMRIDNTSISGCLFAHNIFEFFEVHRHIIEGFKKRNLYDNNEMQLNGLFAMHGSFDATTALFWINMPLAEKRKVITYFIAKMEEIYPEFIDDPILLSYYKDHPIFKAMFDFCHRVSRKNFTKLQTSGESIDCLIASLLNESKLLIKK